MIQIFYVIGVVSGELALSDPTIQGTWTIKVEQGVGYPISHCYAGGIEWYRTMAHILGSNHLISMGAEDVFRKTVVLDFHPKIDCF